MELIATQTDSSTDKVVKAALHLLQHPSSQLTAALLSFRMRFPRLEHGEKKVVATEFFSDLGALPCLPYSKACKKEPHKCAD